MFKFSLSDWKYPFRIIWFKKATFSVKDETQYLDYLEYAEFYGDVYFCCFRPQIDFLGNFGKKNQNGLLKMKIGAYTSSNILNSMVIFIDPVSDQECPF